MIRAEFSRLDLFNLCCCNTDPYDSDLPRIVRKCKKDGSRSSLLTVGSCYCEALGYPKIFHGQTKSKMVRCHGSGVAVKLSSLMAGDVDFPIMNTTCCSFLHFFAVRIATALTVTTRVHTSINNN